jgi:hypothetical protein
MPYPPLAQAKGRARFEANRTPEQRERFYRELAAAGTAARLAKRRQREAAIVEIRQALDTLAAALDTLTGGGA